MTMDYPPSWYFLVIISFLLIPAQTVEINQKLMNSPISPPSDPPYWEHILREYVFKTISPPPPANNVLYKRLLEAPFYSGPTPVDQSGENVILSSGNVYYLPSGQWILCQDTCVNCEICLEQRNPTVKWILRRIKRTVEFHSPRYDLQLTIVPQVDESFHMKNLWPRTYVYVTSQSDQTTIFPATPNHQDRYATLTTERPIPETDPGKPWKGDQQRISENEITERAEVSDVETGKRDLEKFQPVPGMQHRNQSRYNHRLSRRNRQRVRPPGYPGPLSLFHPPSGLFNVTDRLRLDEDPGSPRLILGTDQHGEKQLVHIVPAGPGGKNVTRSHEGPSTSNPLSPYARHHVRPGRTLKEIEIQPTYQKILRKVMNSLTAHKDSIEKFLLLDKVEPNLLKPVRSPFKPSMYATDRPEDPKENQSPVGYHQPSDPRHLPDFYPDTQDLREHRYYEATQNAPILHGHKSDDEQDEGTHVTHGAQNSELKRSRDAGNKSGNLIARGRNAVNGFSSGSRLEKDVNGTFAGLPGDSSGAGGPGNKDEDRYKERFPGGRRHIENNGRKNTGARSAPRSSEKSSRRRYQVVTEKTEEFSGHFQKLDSLFNTNKTANIPEAVLKEMARSVINRAKSVPGFETDDASSSDND